MLRVGRITAVSAIGIAGLMLAGCSTTPAAPPSQGLQFESIPPGANVQTSQGQTCRTPCGLAVPVTAQSVTFTMAGYVDQQIPLSVQAGDHSLFSSKPPFLMPNPVTAAMQALPPPPPKGQRGKKIAGAPAAAPPQPAAPPPELRRAPEPERVYHPPPPQPWNAPSDSSPFPR
jgi:hypothetical protein